MFSRFAFLNDVGEWFWGRPPQDGPRIVMSLDYSIYSFLGLTLYTYSRYIRRAGGRPLQVRYGLELDGKEALDAMAQDLLNNAHGLLLTGGADVNIADFYKDKKITPLDINPHRDKFEIALLKVALQRGIPVLGICRGCQLINLFRGGTLRSLREDAKLKKRHKRLHPHDVYLASDSKLAAVLHTAHLRKVRSLHGMAVEQVGEGLRRVGWAADGVTEAFESTHDDTQSWIMGVQWHPELIFFAPVDKQITHTFINKAKAFMQQSATCRLA